MTGQYLALAALLMFATNIILTKIASGKLDLNTGFLISVAVNIAFAALLVGVQHAIRSDALHWDWLGFAMFAAAGAFSTYLGRWFLLESIARLGPARTSAFQVTSPLFTVVIAWAFLGERLAGLAILAMVVTLLGLLLVTAPARGFGGAGAASATVRGARAARAKAGFVALLRSGLLLGLGSSAAYAVGNVLRGAAIRQWNEAILGALLGALAAVALQLLFGSGNRDAVRRLRAANRVGIALFAISGVLTISAQMCVIAAMKHIPVALVALITLCTPVLVFPLSYFLLKNEEGIGLRTLLGGVMTLAGIATILAL